MNLVKFLNTIAYSIDLRKSSENKFIDFVKILFEFSDIKVAKAIFYESQDKMFKEIVIGKNNEVQINYYDLHDGEIKAIVMKQERSPNHESNIYKFYILKDEKKCICPANVNYDRNGDCYLANFYAYMQFFTYNDIDNLDELHLVKGIARRFIFQSNTDKRIAMLTKKLEETQQEIQLSRSIREELNKEVNLQKSMKKFCMLLKENLDLSKAEICLYDDGNVPLRIGIGFQKEKIDLLSNAGILKRAMKRIIDNPVPHFVPDTSKTNNSKISRINDVKSYINYPLIFENKVIGHIHVARGFSQKSLDEHNLYLVGVMAKASVLVFRDSIYYSKIQNFNETLKKEVEVATEDLQQANDKLRELDELKSDFLNVASHELRTPLTSIKGFIDLLLRGNKDNLTDQQLNFLSIINEESGRLARLINDLLDVNKIESGKMKITKIPIGVQEVQKFLDGLNATARSKNIEIVRNFNFDTLYVDPDRFCQILNNLVGNSIKFSEEGSKVIVTIGDIDRNNSIYYNKLMSYFKNQFEGSDVNTDFKDFNDYLAHQKTSDDEHAFQFFVRKLLKHSHLISVKDFGQGIKQEDFHKLFNKFSQIKTKVREAIGGTGLGLVISKYLVNLHGGDIFVDSEFNDYTEFFFIIPKN